MKLKTGLNELTRLSILGQDWAILIVEEPPTVGVHSTLGTTDWSRNLIYIRHSNEENTDLEPRNLTFATVRHEVIHAYLFSCGLAHCGSPGDYPWTVNEQMVDWWARMGEAVYKTWAELGVLHEPFELEDD